MGSIDNSLIKRHICGGVLIDEKTVITGKFHENHKNELFI